MNPIEIMATEIKNIVCCAIQDGINEAKKTITNSEDKDQEQYLSRKEAADFLKISVVTLDKCIKENLIPSYRIMGSIRLTKNDLTNSLIERKSLKFKTRK